METPLIEFKNVTKRFGSRTILDQVNLKIYEGQISTIIGKSGTGKSVLLKHIIGLLSPDEGSVLFRENPIGSLKKSEWDAYRVQVSYMFQNNALFDSMTVYDNVALPLQQTTNLSKTEIERRVMARIEQTELTEVAYKYPSELSGGMQQRIVIAMALACDPALLIMDEPTTGLDVTTQAKIIDLVEDLQEKVRASILYITHDLATCKYICDRIAIMYLGQILEIGPLDEVFDHPVHPYTISLLAAVPVPDPKFRRTDTIPKGEIPSAIDPPAGCRFHPRCSYAIPGCSVKMPVLEKAAGDHWVACPVRLNAGSR